MGCEVGNGSQQQDGVQNIRLDGIILSQTHLISLAPVACVTSGKRKDRGAAGKTAQSLATLEETYYVLAHAAGQQHTEAMPAWQQHAKVLLHADADTADVTQPSARTSAQVQHAHARLQQRHHLNALQLACTV